ncbi:Ubiquitin family [Carpediemonas membranifera]|uniref:Ubiquitin family n=1 Tax=Carpediemonas membranifera TaxID=201153 RepID=A0A8J6BGS1_9EUKA|nr:Ubiquitin family [Carpediemonas membranifera]|eukprot:KAG9397167.1 Ubiquitin family [Carpediemonas membranifera]
MSHCIRIRRKKLEVFLLVNPTDTVRSVKVQLAAIIQIPAGRQRLLYQNVVLIDNRALEEFAIEDDAEIILTVAKGDDDDFEAPDITPFDAPDEPEEPEEEEAADGEEAVEPADQEVEP